MKMVSLKSHRYGGRLLSPGDEFTAGSRDCRLLSALGRAQKAEDVVPLVETQYIQEPPREAITSYRYSDWSAEKQEPDPEPESEPTSEEAPVRVKRKYKRRDMTAGD